MLIKKRELLPKLKKLISETVALSHDVAALELSDSEDVALRLRRNLLNIQNIHLKALRDDVAAIRFVNKQNKRNKLINQNPVGDIGPTEERNE